MSEVSEDQIEIIQEFIQESQDMIDQLEPTIIELGQSCQDVDCWQTLNCTKTDCPRHGKTLSSPCWLRFGHIGEGDGSCVFTESKQDCLSCQVFEMVNGEGLTMNAIFRLFHSMKGSAGFLEFNNITRAAHSAENLLDLIRSGGIKMQPSHVNLLCKACDFAKDALDWVSQNHTDTDMGAQADDITSTLQEAIDEAKALAQQATLEFREQAPDAAAPETDLLSDLITPEMLERFVQEAEELLLNSEQGFLSWSNNLEDTEILGELFRNIHSFKGNCGFFGYSALERLSHQMETVLDAAKSGKKLSQDNPAEILLELIDALKEGVSDISQGGKGAVSDIEVHLKKIQALIPEGSESGAGDTPKLLGELLIDQGVCEDDIRQAVETQRKPVGEILVNMGKASPDQVQEALSRQEKTRQAEKKTVAAPAKAKQAPAARQDIRVELDKLDNLINLIGEMVIAENMLIHNPDIEGLELENFNKAAQQMGKIVRDLQEMAMLIRMIPVSGLFRRMIRLVHDLSRKSGKKVELILSGEETEVDKTVIETITDPLVHLLRNSLDHGLEPPEERIANGKVEKGVVRLSARHEEGEVWIIIEDDGRGLNKEKILSKAIEKGLVEGDGSDLSDKEIYNLIFQAGFSTADKITDVSGRGVGMDVVKQNLEKVKGKIDVNSQPGKGSRITLRIPLTMAIIDGMLVRVGGTTCIVPTLNIREAFRPSEGIITTTPEGKELVRVREEFLSIVRLHSVLSKAPDSQNLVDGTLIVLEHQDRSACLFVDEIMGQQQTVIKGLSNYIGNVHGVSGCTIQGNGEISLILDIGGIVEQAGH